MSLPGHLTSLSLRIQMPLILVPCFVRDMCLKKRTTLDSAYVSMKKKAGFAVTASTARRARRPY